MLAQRWTTLSIIVCFVSSLYQPAASSLLRSHNNQARRLKHDTTTTSACTDCEDGTHMVLDDQKIQDGNIFDPQNSLSWEEVSALSGDVESDDYDDTRPSPIDILVIVVFLASAAWLVIAIIYSLIILIVLRLQARGELDIYDEDFGRLYCCNRRYSIRIGCILRRYAIRLEEEQRERQQRALAASVAAAGHNNAGESGSGQQVYIMTRQERRAAMEELLVVNNQQLTTVSSDGSKETTDSSQKPVCAICLEKYEATDQKWKSNTCPHRFHKECIMEWLERRANIECPCCRAIMVSDDDVWDVVQKFRKADREKRSKNGILYRIFGKRRGGENRENQENRDNRIPVDADGYPSQPQLDDDNNNNDRLSTTLPIEIEEGCLNLEVSLRQANVLDDSQDTTVESDPSSESCREVNSSLFGSQEEASDH